MSVGSFISEHTAEYILVPDLVRRLTPRFQNVIPLFFWSTREGNSTARETMARISVRILTGFARRPKLLAEDRIIMKVNLQLLQYSRISNNAGFAVLAGIPLVSSLSMLRLTSPCSWFELPAAGSPKRDLYIEVMLDGSAAPEESSRNLSAAPLDDNRIQELADRSPIMSWADAVERLRAIRSEQPELNRFTFFGSYKPFHLILPA